jgi:leader peptidase (prepilin peptidase)/N-methyltransferase
VIELLFGILGAVVGSFLNVCIDRLPTGMSIISSPPSHCPFCQKRIAVKDLIPVFSYLWLRGRCRYCQAQIPQRLLWVELGTGALFAFLYWHYGLSWQLLITIVYSCLFIVVMVIDLEHHIIPNKIVYPGMALALILSLLAQLGVVETEPGIVRAAIGGGAGLVLLLLPALVYRGGMGFGDVKLAALVGLVTGFPLVIVALFLAIVSGGMVAAILLLLKKKRWREGMAFGPFLSLGVMATLFWGADILSWYLGLF